MSVGIRHESCQLPSWLIFDVRRMQTKELTIERYDEVLALMKATPGICVREADSREAVARYLIRNPGLSFLAEEQGRVVGCAMSGHDGRRGYIQHVVVDPGFRRRGVAQTLVSKCLDALALSGITKAHLDVLATNELALGYWQRRGWIRREDIVRFSITSSNNPNA